MMCFGQMTTILLALKFQVGTVASLIHGLTDLSSYWHRMQSWQLSLLSKGHRPKFSDSAQIYQFLEGWRVKECSVCRQLSIFRSKNIRIAPYISRITEVNV